MSIVAWRALERSEHAHHCHAASIADFADDDGRAYPSWALGTECRIVPGTRTGSCGVTRSVELEIKPNSGPHGTTPLSLPRV